MSASGALAEAVDRLDRCDDPAIVVARPPLGWLQDLAAEIDARDDGDVPLRGTTFGIKDNIDLAGVPTTAACPSIAAVPDRSAPVVERLVRAGALPVGKLNMDQFATGLVGTRSPFGTPRNPIDPDLVPGGSSSGSGVAVARGLVTFALGTDTAGSGRVPAAMCGVVGAKPTPGRLSTAGVIPAVRSIDCVSVFAHSVTGARDVVDIAAGFDPDDPYSQRAPEVASPPVRRVGVLDGGCLERLGVDASIVSSYVATCDRLAAVDLELSEVDPGTLFRIGDELYGGPWVTERLAALEGYLRADPPDLDPVVATVLAGASAYSVTDLHHARYRLAAWRHHVTEIFGAVDALAMPTVGWHVTLAEVAADPIAANSRLGRFTTFTNLSGLAALTFPLRDLAIDAATPPPSVTLHGAPWSDDALADVACRVIGEPEAAGVPTGWVRLAVAGAHLRGEPLEWQLIDRGARFLETTGTAPTYRLYELVGSVPSKPALVNAAPDGRSIEVDVWALSPTALGDFLQVVAAPLCLGNVELADGTTVSGFLCEPRALGDVIDITDHGGWRASRRAER